MVSGGRSSGRQENEGISVFLVRPMRSFLEANPLSFRMHAEGVPSHKFPMEGFSHDSRQSGGGAMGVGLLGIGEIYESQRSFDGLGPRR